MIVLNSIFKQGESGDCKELTDAFNNIPVVEVAPDDRPGFELSYVPLKKTQLEDGSWQYLVPIINVNNGIILKTIPELTQITPQTKTITLVIRSFGGETLSNVDVTLYNNTIYYEETITAKLAGDYQSLIIIMPLSFNDDKFIGTTFRLFLNNLRFMNPITNEYTETLAPFQQYLDFTVIAP